MRLIMGQALDVLPRLTDGATTWCSRRCQIEYPKYHAQGVRLLRPGCDVFTDVLSTDAGRRDQETIALREVAKAGARTTAWLPALLRVDQGLLVATKEGQAALTGASRRSTRPRATTASTSAADVPRHTAQPPAPNASPPSDPPTLDPR